MNVRFDSMKTFIPGILLAGSAIFATLPVAASAKSNNNADSFEFQKTELTQQDNSKELLTPSARSADLLQLRRRVAKLEQAKRKTASSEYWVKKYADEKLQLTIKEYKILTGTDLYVTTEEERKNEEDTNRRYGWRIWFLGFLGGYLGGLGPVIMKTIKEKIWPSKKNEKNNTEKK